MCEITQVLETAQDQRMHPMRVSLGLVYLLQYPSVPDMWKRVEKEPLLKRLFGALPLTAYTTLIDRGTLTGAPCRMNKGILFYEDDAQVLELTPKRFRCIDATNAVGCLFRLVNGCFNTGVILECLSAYMHEHRLCAADDLFTQQLVNYVDDSGDAVHYARKIVPLGAEPAP